MNHRQQTTDLIRNSRLRVSSPTSRVPRLRLQVRSTGLLSVVCCLWFLGCAKVADPLPPLVIPPETVSNVETVRVADRQQIIFSLPPQKIQRVELYRQCGNPPFSPENATLLGRTEVEDLPRYPNGSRFFLEDQPDRNQTCSYWLRFVDGRSLSSPFSNSAAVTASE